MSDKSAVDITVDLSEPVLNYPKYHEDGPFCDPLVRCANCGNLDLTDRWKTIGHCVRCGNRRLRWVVSMTEEERVEAGKWGIDPDWFSLFEPVSYE